MAKIYLASSWRNIHQPNMVQLFRNAGHEVYDFRNPPSKSGGFKWSDIDPAWQNWGPDEYRSHLLHSNIAAGGYLSDLRAMTWCDTGILLLPCGASAHSEFGWISNSTRTSIVLLEDKEPELMYLMADHICINPQEVLEILEGTTEYGNGKTGSSSGEKLEDSSA